MELLQKTYNVDLEDYRTLEQKGRGAENFRFTIISCQKMFVYIGELAQFEQMVLEPDTFDSFPPDIDYEYFV